MGLRDPTDGLGGLGLWVGLEVEREGCDEWAGFEEVCLNDDVLMEEGLWR